MNTYQLVGLISLRSSFAAHWPWLFVLLILDLLAFCIIAFITSTFINGNNFIPNVPHKSLRKKIIVNINLSVTFQLSILSFLYISLLAHPISPTQVHSVLSLVSSSVPTILINSKINIKCCSNKLFPGKPWTIPV